MNYQVFDNVCHQFANYVRREIHDLQPRGDEMASYMMDALKANEPLVVELAESPQMRVYALEYLAHQKSITIELTQEAKVAARHGSVTWDDQVNDLITALVPSLASNIGMSEKLVRQFIYEAWSDDATWLGEAAAGIIAEISVMNMLRLEWEEK